MSDSGIVRVDEITALIGPNEAGKSSLLQGLASISMDGRYGPYDLTQLEGVAKRWMDRELLSSDIEIIRAKFHLSAEDKEELLSVIRSGSTKKESESQPAEELTAPAQPPVELDQSPPAPDDIDVRKYHDESYELDLGGKEVRFPSTVGIEISRKAVSRELEKLAEEASSKHFIRGPNPSYRPQFDEAVRVASKLKITRTEDGQLITQKLGELQQFPYDDEFKKFIKSATNRVKKIIETGFLKSDTEVLAYHYLLKRMPKTVYFRIYERIDDEVPIRELRERPNLHKTFVNFLTLAKISLNTIERMVEEGEDSQIPVYLENGCGEATKLLQDAWKQELLEVELRYLDGRLLVYTKNSKAVETLLPPSSGSEGFQWYFGFYTNFGAATKAEYKNAILLLDDPGVFLHPKGHRELLQLFENYLKYDVMTLYSTHLPFLIPRDKLSRLRLVEKDGAHSRVSEKFWAISDKDVLYPIRATLGVTLADSLYAGSVTLITEGPSDSILLNGMLELFRKRRIRRIRDPSDIHVLSGKGASKAKGHAILLEIERLPYVLVLDNDQQGQAARTDAIEDGIPENKILLLPAASGNAQNEFAIEDLFPSEIYARALYAVHGTELNMTPSETIAKLGAGNEKVSNKAKRLLKNGSHDLDKVKVAKELLKLVSEGALNILLEARFGQLFDELNSRVGLYDEAGPVTRESPTVQPKEEPPIQA